MNKTRSSGLSDALKIIREITIPSHLRYTKDHVWVLLVKDATGLCMVGVTEIVTRRFLTVTHVELPKEFEDVSAGDTVSTIVGISEFDRIEASFPVVTPIKGAICPANPILRKRLIKRSKPEFIKLEPYRDGWLFGIMGNVEEQFEQLMTPEAYRLYLEKHVKNNPTFIYCFDH